jgi:ribosome-binding ATPase YchF (GTP1/OBG family)
VKSVGLVGVPFSGKSTLFTALTRTGAAGGRANQAVVPVPDPRPEVLARLEGSSRVSHAQVRFVDVPGGTAPQALATLREADALCVVLRAFGPGADPAAELREVTADLLLADLAVVESALEGAARRARSRAREAVPELAALERAREALSAEVPLREARLEDGDPRLLRGFGLLTLKPWVVVANLEEGGELPPGLPEGTVGVLAELEAEAASLDPEEAGELLRAFGVEEPGLARVVRACYRALDLITFLTANREEARAWQLPRGARALEAAGTIHTDMARGFIRAEVVSFDDLVAAGGWHGARAKGLARVEGKDYVVREGDVLHIRFAV